MKYAAIEFKKGLDKRINICVTLERHDDISGKSWIIGCEHYKVPSDVGVEPCVDAVIKKLEKRGFQVY